MCAASSRAFHALIQSIDRLFIFNNNSLVRINENNFFFLVLSKKEHTKTRRQPNKKNTESSDCVLCFTTNKQDLTHFWEGKMKKALTLNLHISHTHSRRRRALTQRQQIEIISTKKGNENKNTIWRAVVVCLMRSYLFLIAPCVDCVRYFGYISFAAARLAPSGCSSLSLGVRRH